MRKTYSNPFYDWGIKLHSIKELVTYTGYQYSDNVAIRYKEKNEVIEKTYKELLCDVQKTAKVLKNFDLQTGHVAILGRTSYDWIVSYLGIVYGGLVAVPLDTQLNDAELAELMIRADVDCILGEERYVKNVQELVSDSNTINIIINESRERREGKEDFLSMDKLRKEVQCIGTEEEIDPELLAVIVFTSGTTGKSKGVMLSHKNIITDVMSAKRILGLDEKDSSLSILPLYHTYEMTCDILLMLYFGASVSLNDSLKYLSSNLKLMKPSVLFSVPMVIEQMYQNIILAVKDQKKEKLFEVMLKVSSILRKMGFSCYKKLFANVREQFGGNLKLIVCGGSNLDQDYIDFFDNIGINVVHGYGITECSPLLSANPDCCKKRYSVGPVVSCCQVKVDNSQNYGCYNGHEVGEIMAKGDNIMLGYYNDTQGTREVMKGEWFKTGDIGYIDEDNYLFITGRVKNLIILANGKNVSPENLESRLNKIDVIKEVVVSSRKINGSEHILATIFCDEQVVQEHQISDIKKYVDEQVTELNRTLPSYMQITSIEFRDKEFEKTSTKKIKRY